MPATIASARLQQCGLFLIDALDGVMRQTMSMKTHGFGSTSLAGEPASRNFTPTPSPRRRAIRPLKRFLVVAVLFIAAAEAAAQNYIINGDFETTTATGCAFNQSNTGYNSLMTASTAFGRGEIDIMQGDCGYSLPPQSGSYKLGIAGTTGAYDALSLTLSAPVAAGSSYDLSFYAVNAYPQYGTPQVEIGVSNSPNGFGTGVYSATIANSATWVRYAANFTAPLSGSYLTVTLSADRWAHIDNFCLTTAGSGNCFAGPLPDTPTPAVSATPTATETPTPTPVPDTPTFTPTLANGCAHEPMPGCRTAQKSLLVIKQNGGARDKLVYKWIKGSLPPGELADPTATTTYRACVYHGTGNDFLESVAVPPAGPRWREIRNHGYVFTDPLATSDGVSKLVLNGNAVTGKAKVVLKGKGHNLPDPPIPSIALPVTVQVINPDSGVCAESVFNSGLVHTPTLFKAKTP